MGYETTLANWGHQGGFVEAVEGGSSYTPAVSYSITQDYQAPENAVATFADPYGADWDYENGDSQGSQLAFTLDAVNYDYNPATDSNNDTLNLALSNNDWTFVSPEPGGFTITYDTPSSGHSFDPLQLYVLYGDGSAVTYFSSLGTTFTDGLYSPMIATITVTGEAGTWSLFDTTLDAGATTDQVKAAIGTTEEDDTVTAVTTGPTTVYTITTPSGDYSGVVATAHNVNLS